MIAVVTWIYDDAIRGHSHAGLAKACEAGAAIHGTT